MGKFIAVALAGLAVVVITLLIALLLIKIGWALFIVPVFGLPELTWLQALGFAFLAGAFKQTKIRSKS